MTPAHLIVSRGSSRTIIDYGACRMAEYAMRNFVYSKLTDYDWNHQTKRFVPSKRYAKSNQTLERIYIPVGLTSAFCEHMDQEGIPYELKNEQLVVPRAITAHLKPSFTPRAHQLPIIEYLKQPSPARKGLATFTGSGKTVSSIAGALESGHVIMVVVAGLTQQWLASIQNFVDIQPDKLYLIQGVQSLVDLFVSDLTPEIFVVSLATLRLYVNRDGAYRDIPPYEKFLRQYGIGTKIFDEVHLNFHAGTIIDLHSNVVNNVYLTATFTSASKTTKRIFDAIYPQSMRFGEDKKNVYIDAISYMFTGDVNENKCSTHHGYMHAKYEKLLLRDKQAFKYYMERVIFPLINAHWYNKRVDGQKLIIYFMLTALIEEVYLWLVKNYPDCRINKYIANAPPSLLEDVDIIISSPKKSGCGTDIKNLRTLINTVSAKSVTQVLQQLGRLRELPDGTTPEYIEVWDSNIATHRYYAHDREETLRPHVRSFSTYRLP